jgi:thiosulfate dehydrogenase [quinone] large subunit
MIIILINKVMNMMKSMVMAAQKDAIDGNGRPFVGVREMVFQSLVTLMRVLFGVAWFLAGVTKIVEKKWFSQPGVFLKGYLTESLTKPNVPEFYKYFVQHVALKHVMFFNYTIPVVQMVVGLFLILGLLIIPSVLICLLMHVNFILSGNMNLISLILYTSAFGILLCLDRVYVLSWDRNLGLENLFLRKRRKRSMRGNISIVQES